MSRSPLCMAPQYVHTYGVSPGKSPRPNTSALGARWVRSAGWRGHRDVQLEGLLDRGSSPGMPPSLHHGWSSIRSTERSLAFGDFGVPWGLRQVALQLILVVPGRIDAGPERSLSACPPNTQTLVTRPSFL